MRWRNTSTQWGWLVVISHWVSFLVVLCLFASGLWMVELDYYHSWYHKAPYLHKSTGFVLFVLVVFRIFLYWFERHPKPLKMRNMFEQRIAPIVHKLLYLIFMAVMISGYMISTAEGRGIEVFDWFEVPALFSGFDKQEDIAGDIHFWLASGFMFLIVFHASAAIKHHLIDKDNTLKRMLGRDEL